MATRLPDSDSVERLLSEFEVLDQVARTDSTFGIERELDGGHRIQQYSEGTLVDEFAG